MRREECRTATATTDLRSLSVGLIGFILVTCAGCLTCEIPHGREQMLTYLGDMDENSDRCRANAAERIGDEVLENEQFLTLFERFDENSGAPNVQAAVLVAIGNALKKRDPDHLNPVVRREVLDRINDIPYAEPAERALNLLVQVAVEDDDYVGLIINVFEHNEHPSVRYWALFYLITKRDTLQDEKGRTITADVWDDPPAVEVLESVNMRLQEERSASVARLGCALFAHAEYDKGLTVLKMIENERSPEFFSSDRFNPDGKRSTGGDAMLTAKTAAQRIQFPDSRIDDERMEFLAAVRRK